MRYFIMIIVLLLCGNSVAQHYYVVSARNGLNVRSGANLDAEKIAKLPYGVVVKILEETNKELTIQDEEEIITGTWVRVWYNNYTYFVSEEKQDYEGDGYVLDYYLKKMHDDTLVITSTIDEESYNALKENTIDTEYTPVKISELDSIKTILKGRVEWGNQYEDYSFENTFKSIIIANGQKLTVNQRQNEFGFYQDFGGYYPEEEVLLMEGGHSSDVAFSIETGEIETAGNPEYSIPSPKGTIRLNGLHSGQECIRYFLQKKVNGTFEYLTEFISPIDICTFEEFCWVDEKTFIYKIFNYSDSIDVMFLKGKVRETNN